MQWNRLPREVEFLSLETFKNPPGHVPVSPDPGDPILAGGLGQMISKGPFQP